MFELITICLLILTPLEKQQGFTEKTVTMRQIFTDREACVNRANELRKNIYASCEAFCKALK